MKLEETIQARAMRRARIDSAGKIAPIFSRDRAAAEMGCVLEALCPA